MPVKCPGGRKPRFRVKKTRKGKVRLARGAALLTFRPYEVKTLLVKTRAR